ncbi:MAG: asparagine synthase (glutamine-hydrolyzing) [Luteitalea sp.]|nr:asparagine synthase (glutamine-hydrolyzing) [Luteitalea sp.]
MCGIAGLVGGRWRPEQLDAMVASQRHRGPDASAVHIDVERAVGLGHNRLSILDLSRAGLQPMASHDGRYWIAFNGEVYNYLELKAELDTYPYRSATDTEVILAAYERWGVACLHRFVGMFAFLIWDRHERRLIAARDRFGVKPLVYHRRNDGSLVLASEIRALHAAGVPAAPDATTWATYLTYGLSDHSERTFWDGISSLAPGCALTWHNGQTRTWQWYDLKEQIGVELDTRPIEVVREEYLGLLAESVRFRFRADVPVGVNLSGGLDSSTLLGLVQQVQGAGSNVTAFTFVTGDPRYDELPWVQQMLARTEHPSVVCRLRAGDVPDLAASVQLHQDEPFGGLPTLAYARLFERARDAGVTVLLDGQGMDEQWAGYDYYVQAMQGGPTPLVQGMREKPVRPHCLTPELARRAEPFEAPTPFPDALRNAQFRDARYTKIPRALRFNDRVSMRSSIELREPFLDHRMFELALRQPADRKIAEGMHKCLLRQLTEQLLPEGLIEAPKRPVQTPQREWLAGELREWADSTIERGLTAYGGVWLDADAVRAEWRRYCLGGSDNSFYVWQWISVGLFASRPPTRSETNAQFKEMARPV